MPRAKAAPGPAAASASTPASASASSSPPLANVASLARAAQARRQRGGSKPRTAPSLHVPATLPTASSASSSPSPSSPSPSSSAPSRSIASLYQLFPAVDVLSELETDRSRYIGREWLTLLHWPGYLATSLDRVRAQASLPTPGISPTLACCIEHGMSALERHAEIRGLLDLKHTIDNLEGMNASAVDVAAAWYRSFPVGVDVTLSGTRKQNLTVPEPLKIRVHDLASDLGLSLSALSVLAATTTLSKQPSVLPEHADMMIAAVKQFLKLALLRRKGGQGMIEALREIEEW